MKTIKKFDIVSIGKTFGILYAILGLILGAGFSIGALIMGQKIPGAFFGVAAVIVIPIIYGLMGFIAGAMAGFLYNISSKYSGGIKIELTD